MHKNKIFLLFSFIILQTHLCAQIYTDYIGAGHSEGLSIMSSSSDQTVLNQEVTTNGTGLIPDLKESSRFLRQATLGANYETIVQVQQQGFSDWLDAQFSMPLQSDFQQSTDDIWEYFKAAYIQKWGSNNVVGNDQVLPYWFYWRMAWWENIMKKEDLLRQRIAQVLSEILVVSEKSGLQNSGLGLANYYDLLYEHAFGNYRDLLYNVTMHPCMGIYLSHMNNPKSDPVNNIHPDENYAREIMQLFSIGLYELNNDGTRKTDSDGNFIPTYDNADIREFAKIFTGLAPAEYYWPWEDYSIYPVEWGNEYNDMVATINMTMPMQMFEDWHEAGAKNLLNGMLVPNGQTGLQDINDAIDNLFHHPNTPPFISHLLIQRLVKSNPTPAYVERVANAFINNGQGERGDLKAVIRAILMDAEARDCSWVDDPHHGKLNEPLTRATQCLRAFNASNNSGRLWNWAYSLEEATHQHILASPSVFNFYLPEYQPNGSISDEDLVAPEFQIHTSSTAIKWINLMERWFFHDEYMFISTVPSNLVIESPTIDPNRFDPDDYIALDLSDEITIANDAVALVDRLDLILTGNGLSATTKTTIVNTINQINNDDETRVRAALYLVMVSPDYAVRN